MSDIVNFIPFTFKAAAYNGILSPRIQPLPASCPTGNCTWPITPSLAICGGCSNSTYQVSCDADTSESWAAIDETWAKHRSVCLYTMPSGGAAFLGLNDRTAPQFQVMPSKGAAYNSSDPSMLYIANFDLIGLPDNLSYPLAFPGDWSPPSVVAAECAMWFCVQAYDINVTTTQQTQFSQNITKGVLQNSPKAVESNVSDPDEWSNFTFPNLPAEMNPCPDSQFNVTLVSALLLKEFFTSLFSGNVSGIPDFPEISSDITQAIWNATTADLDGWMKNVALSMTNALRVFNPALDDVYNGTGYQLGVQVRWRWIILPAVLVLSSLLILIVTIVKTAKSPMQAWKGSPLALLFTDVDQDILKRAEGRMDVYKGLEDSVGKIKVMMKNDDNGNWTFKAA